MSNKSRWNRMAREFQPNLSNDEILCWIKQYQKCNDSFAQTKIVLHFTPLIQSIARKYSKDKTIYEDVVQVGMLGLLGAIRRFDISKGQSFEAFALPTIIGEIKRFLRDKTWDVHVPRRIKELTPKINMAVETLTMKLQRSPSILEIADYLQVEEEVLETLEIGKNYRAVSMNYTFQTEEDGNNMTLFEIIGKEDAGFELTNSKLILSEAFQTLNEREKQIINLTFFEQFSQREVGELLGISQMHVSRIQRRAIEKLRDTLNIQFLSKK